MGRFFIFLETDVEIVSRKADKNTVGEIAPQIENG